MNRAQLMTVRWNNLLALGLGVPMGLFAAATPWLTDWAAFVGMALFGSFY